jgi:hypothetical protein
MQASTIPNLSGIENPVFVSSVWVQYNLKYSEYLSRHKPS